MQTSEVIGGGELEPISAAAFNFMQEDFYAEFGYYLPVASTFRKRNEQQYYYDGWVAGKPGFNFAAVPGTSPHERGIAVDFGYPGSVVGTDMHNWLRANSERYGFVWTGKDFRIPEAWHFEFLQNGAFVEALTLSRIKETDKMILIYVMNPNEDMKSAKGVIGSINAKFETPAEREHFVNIWGAPGKPKHANLEIKEIKTPFVASVLRLHTKKG